MDKNQALTTAKNWFKKANSVFKYAQVGLNSGELGPFCVDLHQTTELCLKTILAYYQSPIQRTHNLPFLLSLVVEKNEQLTVYQQLCADLNPYYISEKYPTGSKIEPVKSKVLQLLKQVNDLIKDTKELLANED